MEIFKMFHFSDCDFTKDLRYKTYLFESCFVFLSTPLKGKK